MWDLEVLAGRMRRRGSRVDQGGKNEGEEEVSQHRRGVVEVQTRLHL